MPTIDEVSAAIPDWAGRRIEAVPISGGLTNRNYRVEVDGVACFVRVPGPATELLAIDRANELANTRAAALAGVGPRVLHHLPAWDVIVLEWLPGRTMSNEAFGEPAMAARIAATLRRLHAGPRFQLDFDMFRLTERYLRVVDELGAPIPAGYREHLGQVPRIEAALAARPLARVPCHNDLLAENYLDDGTRLWIVDYEYSGNNDPTFELGNTCQELGFDDDRVETLCAAYFGEQQARSARPDAPPDDHVRRRLDALGGDPGAGSRRSTTTSWAGPTSAGRAPRRRSTDPISAAGWPTPEAEPRRGQATDTAASAALAAPAGIDEDVDGHGRRKAPVEDVHLEHRPLLGFGPEVDRPDRPLHGVPVGGAAQPPDDDAIEPDRLAAVDRDPVRIADEHRPQSARRAVGPALPPGEDRIATDERALVRADERAEAGLVGRVEHRQVGPEVAISLLEPERVEGPVAERLQACVMTGRREPIPHGRRPGRSDIELPTELTGIADPRGHDGRRADPDVDRPAKRQRGIVDGIVAHLAQDGPRRRSPESKAGPRLGLVDDVDRRIVGLALERQPAHLAGHVSRAGDHPEATPGRAG